jgi:hypothetical protein
MRPNAPKRLYAQKGSGGKEGTRSEGPIRTRGRNRRVPGQELTGSPLVASTSGSAISSMRSPCHSARQKRKLFHRQMPGLALGEIAERQASNGNANEAKHLHVIGVEQAADMTVASLVENDFKP